MAAIELRGIRKSFRDTPVLQGVSLDIADGEFLTLVGPSGCGKTTLLRIIAGLEFQDSGDVAVGGRSVDDLAPKERDLAMVFQSYALYPYMTVAENMALPLVMRRMSLSQRLPLVGGLVPGSAEVRRAIEAEVTSVAQTLGIRHLLQRRPAQLSGGQRQRVALGRAMVRHPQAFLMDEPLSNLDAKLRVHARAEIAELHRRLGATFVYVTHDQAEAMTMSDRVAVMMGGCLLQVAPPQSVYDDPATLEVARFIGTPEINVLPARVRTDKTLDVLGRAWPILAEDAPAGLPVHVGVRPEAWVVQAGEAAVGALSIQGRVRHLELLGSETLVHVGVDGLQEPVLVRVDPASGGTRRLGEPVTLSARAGRVLVFDEKGVRLPVGPVAPATRLVEVAHG